MGDELKAAPKSCKLGSWERNGTHAKKSTTSVRWGVLSVRRSIPIAKMSKTLHLVTAGLCFDWNHPSVTLRRWRLKVYSSFNFQSLQRTIFPVETMHIFVQNSWDTSKCTFQCNKLSGWWFQPLWKIWKSVGMIIPYIWKTSYAQPWDFGDFGATAGQPQRTLPLGVEPAHRPSKGRILAHLARWVRASLGELDQ